MTPGRLAVLVLWIFATSLGAQPAWTPATSPTTQNLWGSCHDGTGTFVLVGGGGTILTSPNGTTWTARAVGTMAALRAVAYSATLQRFVAVGDAGTILTSPDAITWAAVTSGTGAQLNGIAWGGGRFLTVGASGTALVSPDGFSWLVRGTGVTADLRAIAYGLGQFVVGGQGGTLLTTTDGTQFLRRGIVTTGAVEALAFDGTKFLAVGDNGLFVTASDPRHWIREKNFFSNGEFYHAATFATGQQIAAGNYNSSTQGIIISRPEQFNGGLVSAPVYTLAAGGSVLVAAGQGGAIFRLAPAPTFNIAITAQGVAAFGQSLTLRAEVTGTAPFTYQWFRDNAPIAGATGATLVFPGLRASDSGGYHVNAANATNPNRSSPQYVVAVSDVPPDGAAIDRTFDAGLPGTPLRLVEQPDGRVLVSGPMFFYPGDQPQYGLGRLNVDGSIDDTFRIAPGVFPAGDGVGTPELQADGTILVPFTDSSYVTMVARLSATGGWIETIAPLSGIKLASGGRVQFQFNFTSSVTIVRTNPDGTPLDSIALNLGVVSGLSYYSAAFPVFDPQGRIVVAAVSYQRVGTGVFGVNLSRFFRLQPDGSLDASFPFASIDDPITALWCHPPTGRLYYRAQWASGGLGSNSHMKFGRLDPTGAIDATYSAISFVDLLGAPQRTISTFGYSADGSFLLTSGTKLFGPDLRIVRHDPNGIEDPNFSATVFDASFVAPFPGRGAVEQIVPASNGTLYLITSAPALNGLPRAYLARIFPETNDASSRLTNLSIRSAAGTDSDTLIVGFAVAGQGNKAMLVRGVGPGLADFNVPNPLADPQLTLYSGAIASLTNDDWSDGSTAAEVIARGAALGAFPLTNGSKDAAAIATLSSGLFTMHVGAADNSTGIVLAEAYDADGPPADFTAPRVVNFSARAPTATGSATLIAGFAVSGGSAKRVLIRAIGPGLIPFDVDGTLVDPVLTLFAGPDAIATNDDWGGNPGSDIVNAFDAVGAFGLPPDSKDSALLVTLAPGTYTAQVNGVAGTTEAGVALIEVYEMP